MPRIRYPIYIYIFKLCLRLVFRKYTGWNCTSWLVLQSLHRANKTYYTLTWLKKYISVYRIKNEKRWGQLKMYQSTPIERYFKGINKKLLVIDVTLLLLGNSKNFDIFSVVDKIIIAYKESDKFKLDKQTQLTFTWLVKMYILYNEQFGNCLRTLKIV